MNAVLHQILLYGFYALSFYYSLLIIEMILSWFGAINNRFYAILSRITDPYNNIFRGRIVIGWFDLSGSIGLVLFYFILRYISSIVFS